MSRVRVKQIPTLSARSLDCTRISQDFLLALTGTQMQIYISDIIRIFTTTGPYRARYDFAFVVWCVVTCRCTG